MVENRTQVVVLQHPRERTHPFGTARLAELGLRQVDVVVDHAGRVRRSPNLLGPLDGAALLYPSALARDVTTLRHEERPARLLVIDGTWHHAKTLYRDIPALARLPHLTLPPHLRSAFRIRRQPDVHCLSTIEAIAFALSALEPETPGIEGLLAAFMRMQAEQLSEMGGGGRARKRKRAREARGISRFLAEDYASLVIAYAESRLDEAAPGRRSLLCCAARRVGTGEHFFRVIRQPRLSDAHLSHLGVTREQVELGVTLEQFREDWSRFLGPNAALAAWNHGTLALLGGLSLRPVQSSVSLKSVYLNLKRHHGPLEDVVELEQLGQSGPLPSGAARAERRLEHAVRLADFLHRGTRIAPANAAAVVRHRE